MMNRFSVLSAGTRVILSPDQSRDLHVIPPNRRVIRRSLLFELNFYNTTDQPATVRLWVKTVGPNLLLIDGLKVAAQSSATFSFVRPVGDEEQVIRARASGSEVVCTGCFSSNF